MNVSTLVNAFIHFPNLRVLLRQTIRDCVTFFGVGCGKGSPISRLIASGDYLVGIDLYPPPTCSSVDAPGATLRVP